MKIPVDSSSDRSSDSFETSAIRSLAPFVGRQAEFGWLEDRLDQTIGGHAQLVLITGDAGIGKTRLTRQLGEAARSRGCQVWYGRSREDLLLPYLLFEPLFRKLEQASARGPDSDVTASIGQIVRGMLERDSSADASSLPDGAEMEPDRLRLYQAFSEGLFRCGRTRPLLVILEDLHWSDAASLSLLTHLAYCLSDADEALPLMIVGTLRPNEGGESLTGPLERLRREAVCHSMNLMGLEEGEVDELMRGLGLDDPSQLLVGRISRVTRGNPLFVEETFQLLSRSGAFVQHGGRWFSKLDPEELSLADDITTAVEVRTRSLSQDCRDTLTLAACLGDAFDVESLAEVTECDEDKLVAHLDEALSAQVLVSHDHDLHFAHPLMRHAFYTKPSIVRRQQIHRRIAEALERLNGDPEGDRVQQIAHHWIRSQSRRHAQKVLHYARLAGQQAFSIFASGDAARFFEAAIDADRRSPLLSTEERAELHYKAALSHFRNMDGALCVEKLEEAAKLYRLLGDTAGLARALIEQVRCSFSLAPVPYGTLFDVSELEQTLALMGESEPALRGWICFTLTDAYMHARQTGRAIEYGERAIALGEELGDERLLAAGHMSLGSARSQKLAVRDALASYQESSRHAARAKDAWVAGWALQRMPLTFAWLGRLEDADAIQREAESVARLTGDAADHSLATGARATLATVRGEFAEAERIAQETMITVSRCGYPWGGLLALTAMYAARALRGDWEEAEDALAILEAPGRVFAEPGEAAYATAAVARLRLQALSGRASEETATQAGNLCRAMLATVGPEVGTISPFCTFVEIADVMGDRELAAQAVPALQFAEGQGVVFAGGGEFLIPRVLGIAAAVEERWEDAASCFESAMEIAERVGALPDQALSRLGFARALYARGRSQDRERAESLLREAIPIFRRLGMKPHLERALALAVEHGVGIEVLPDAAAAGELDPRERQVLTALARGRDDDWISETLLISKESLRRRREALFEKLEVEGRTGAAAVAFERGLAEPSGPDPGSTLVRATTDGNAAAQRGPLIILVSDIEKSTQLIVSLGDLEAQKVIREHNEIVRACLRAHDGVEIQHTGDGFIASFDSASDAIACATRMQARFAVRNAERPDWPLRVRVGLHAGEPLPEEGRLFGVAMHTAARICSHALGGEVIVSDEIRLLAQGREIEFDGLGRVELKGLAAPRDLYRVMREGSQGLR